MHPILATAVGTVLAGGALAAQAAEYGRVISSIPVTSSAPVARQVCDEGRQLVREPSSGAGALIGAIAGGVIGNSIGHGSGRALATGAGAITGAVVGDRVEAGGNRYAEVPVQRCRTVSRFDNRVIGYDVTYDYAGERYTTRMSYDPGRRVSVDVAPQDPGAFRDDEPTYSAPIREVPRRADYVYEQAPRTIYYEPLPSSSVYYTPYAPLPAAAYIAPAIGFGVGYYIGGRGGHRWHGGHRGFHGRHHGRR